MYEKIILCVIVKQPLSLGWWVGKGFSNTFFNVEGIEVPSYREAIYKIKLPRCLLYNGFSHLSVC